MERQIRYRGYNLRNKKWIYGYYFVNRGKHFIADDGLAAPGATWEDFEVDSESVGQYVCTVYGVEIYEGDTVQLDYEAFFKERFIGIVSFYETSFCLLNKYGKVTSLAIREGCGCTYTVIGNEYERKIKGNG